MATEAGQRAVGARSDRLTTGVATSNAMLSLADVPEQTAGRRRTLVALQFMILSLVVLQRFAVPGLTTALCVPIVLAVTTYLVAHDLLVEEPRPTGLYLLAMTLCCLSTLVSAALFGANPSVTSLALLLVLYAPFCFRLRAGLQDLYRDLLEFFNRLMVLLAVVALVQWGAQIAGWPYQDLFTALPQSLVLQDYNTFYPIYYGSDIMKTNAVVFLEPSFCSQYLALAVVIQLLLGGKRWRLALYLGAILTTLSGTGLLLLALGVSVLILRRGARWAVQTVVIVGLAIVIVSLTPLGGIIGPRLSETTTTNSSGNARFIAPYAQVADGLSRDFSALIFGRGPGAVARSSGDELFNPYRLEINYPVIPKLAAEYGLIAAIVFGWFILSAIAGRARSPTLAAVLLLLYLVLSGGLLQPATVYTCLVLGAFFRKPAGQSTGPSVSAVTRRPRYQIQEAQGQ
jgi:hypothetical protein